MTFVGRPGVKSGMKADWAAVLLALLGAAMERHRRRGTEAWGGVISQRKRRRFLRLSWVP